MILKLHCLIPSLPNHVLDSSSSLWTAQLYGQANSKLKLCYSLVRPKQYISCSEALQAVIPIMNLLDEVHSLGIITSAPKTKIHCKLFCDNTGACELLKLPKVRPHTKHFNNKLHHFQEHVATGCISIHYIPTTDQQGDIATKPLALPLLQNFASLFLGGNLHNTK
jgi:hypothetical protein